MRETIPLHDDWEQEQPEQRILSKDLRWNKAFWRG